jgi:hypothetical protein
VVFGDIYDLQSSWRGSDLPPPNHLSVVVMSFVMASSGWGMIKEEMRGKQAP